MEIRPGYVDKEECLLLWEELDPLKDYLSGGRWRSALSDEPGVLSLEGSSVSSKSRKWTPRADALRRRLSNDLGVYLNFVLVNHYKNGKERIAYHSDNERNSEPTIVSVSLGATRMFRTYEKRTGVETDTPLGDGDLCVLRGAFNQDNYHCVPKDKLCDKPRINLTFREVYPNKVRGSPPRPFDTPKVKLPVPGDLPFSVVKRCDAAGGDYKVKVWGNVGNYVVLDDMCAEKERERGGGYKNADVYLRPRVDIADLMSEIRKECLRTFPRGENFMPGTCTVTQIVNICRQVLALESFRRVPQYD